LREARSLEQTGDLLAALARYREALAQVAPVPRQLALSDAQLRTAGELLHAVQSALAAAQARARRAILVGPDWLAGPVVEALSAKGFTAAMRPAGSEREALDSARAQGVPWVIVLDAKTAAGGRIFSQMAATASLDVRAVEARSGAVAAAQMKQGKGFGRTAEAAQQDAAQQAARAAGIELADALVAKESAGL
ncbi:MAG TPA: hypothetical protein VG496_15650, partial [Myxococcales bacterium]|nr:hypothetical protein [Myxococcales bacterium]